MGTGMGLRLELFVRDMDTSIDFYRRALGFELLRRDSAYASLRNGNVLLGLGPVLKLPAEKKGYFTRDIASARRGLGVEIVLEVDDVDALHTRVVASGHEIFEPPQVRPWGLRDFRIADPDGYYLRITSKA